MRYFLFKLAGKMDQDIGKAWALYEYTDATFTKKLREDGAPFIVTDIYCSTPTATQKVGNAYFVATTGELRIDERGKAWIT